MQEYTYDDFINTLDDTGKRVADTIHDHITSHYPEYKPFNIRPMNSTLNKWQMNFRKKPEFGKAFCSLYSVDGKLSMRVIGSGFMNYELFLRQDGFGEKIRNYFFSGGFCDNCEKKCFQEYREYWYINGELLVTGCKRNETAKAYIGVIDDYAAINNVNDNDIKDLRYLLDIQAKHIVKPKNTKEIRGNGYFATSQKRCGDVNVITLEQTKLDIDDFEISDYCNAKRLDKYIAEYNLTPMGAYDGFWFYHDQKAVCGENGNDYSHTAIPQGCYATVTVNDPFSFSAWRVWTYIAGWVRVNDNTIRPVNINGADIPFFVKFYRQNNGEYMSVYVPIE